MPIEHEIKARVADRSRLRSLLRQLGAELVAARAPEDNCLVDDGRLRAGRQLLRIRRSAGRAWLTWKGPVAAEPGIKSREEIETACDDPDALGAILDRLGFTTVFRYQKFRETWRLGALRIMVDETPIGDFVEIEADPAEARGGAALLGIRDEDVVADSYPALYARHAREHGTDPAAMLFATEDHGDGERR